jgi:hypothetical protein
MYMTFTVKVSKMSFESKLSPPPQKKKKYCASGLDDRQLLGVMALGSSTPFFAVGASDLSMLLIFLPEKELFK